MFSYTISNVADNSVFQNACLKLESAINDLKKSDCLVDVDGTIIQKYSLNHSKIIITNDYEVDAVYIDSEISLDSILF